MHHYPNSCCRAYGCGCGSQRRAGLFHGDQPLSKKGKIKEMEEYLDSLKAKTQDIENYITELKQE
jgi:hypothetical protein